MENKFLLTVYDQSKNDAGPKAKKDIEKFLLDDGFRLLNIKLISGNGIYSKLRKFKVGNFDVPKIFKKNIDVFVVQYPFYSGYLMEKILKILNENKKIKLFLIIHDIESLRLFKNNQHYVSEEIKTLNRSDGLIVHNSMMAKWLKDNGVTTKMVELGIFDYESPQTIENQDSYSNSLYFAGNLKKAEFISKIRTKYSIELFGPNPQKNYPSNIHYCGTFPAEELPKYLTGGFGLVWDGTKLSKCDGIYGEYMKYNNPHKVSLYLSSGIPVIIWKEAALASFIYENKLGLLIDNLNDIDRILDSMTPTKYYQMKKNVERIGRKMRDGEYIKTAVHKLVD